MIQSVLKAIKVMELFSTATPRLTLAEISESLDMPKSTTHNILNTLASEGYIERVDGDQYALGTTIITLTQAVRINVELRDRAASLLRQLAEEVHYSAYLAYLENNTSLYIFAIESPRRLLARTSIGDRVPLHCTGIGKAILSRLSKQEVAAIVGRVGLHQDTENTITNFDDLYEELTRTRERGYAIDRGEHKPYIYCIAAPILNASGRVIAACSISGSDLEIIGSREEELSQRVMRTAEDISRRMGYVPDLYKSTTYGIEHRANQRGTHETG